MDVEVVLDTYFNFRALSVISLVLGLLVIYYLWRCRAVGGVVGGLSSGVNESPTHTAQ